MAWFILLFILLCQSIFSISLIKLDTIPSLSIAVIQFIVLLTSIALLFRNFSRTRTTNYKKGFYAFGSTILHSVPTAVFLFFGISFLITDNFTVLFVGLALSTALYLAILYGIIFGRWNWKTHNVSLTFSDLPTELNGLKIVQISDVHIGSFFGQTNRVQKAIDLINKENADYVLFTGDLVNNIAAEMTEWIPLFSSIQAKKGKFSILGNHDYGDYVRWENEEEKSKNLKDLIEMHKRIGFQPLLNDALSISTSENEAWLLGVENWGKPPFRQSGQLKETLELVPAGAFKLLMSHDPSHFDEQVVNKTDVHLTLSGHTHGMQFGIDRFGIKWSPVSLKYKKWAGLYQEGKQFLYVNRGFGYLGFPGRVGIYPEITAITLNKH